MRISRLLIFATLLLAGCRQDMHDQPRYKPLAGSTFFADGRGSRPLVEGTVARGQLKLDRPLYAGRTGVGAVQASQPTPAPPVQAAAGDVLKGTFDADYVTEFPFPITRQVLERGHDRYNIFCTPCHDYTGSGRGMIVQRGLTPPPTYHQDRLRKAPVGHFFDVITNGYGAMYSYAQRIPVRDRWAIIAYIRALQLSQSATIEDVPADKRASLSANQQTPESKPEGVR